MAEKVSRIKFYEDNLTNKSIFTSPVTATWDATGKYTSYMDGALAGKYTSYTDKAPANKYSSSNVNGEINKSAVKDTTNKLVSLDRQFAPVINSVDRDLETVLRNADNCKDMRRERYNYDEVLGIGSSRYEVTKRAEENVSNNKMKGTFLIDQPKMAEQVKITNQFCSERKRNLDWSDYRAPAKQVGQGFGNPENYSDTYLGLDSRLRVNQQEIEQNPRSVDMELRSMVPIDGFRPNFAGIKYTFTNFIECWIRLFNIGQIGQLIKWRRKSTYSADKKFG